MYTDRDHENNEACGAGEPAWVGAPAQQHLSSMVCRANTESRSALQGLEAARISFLVCIDETGGYAGNCLEAAYSLIVVAVC
jgi:hypothetical protein